MAPRRLPGTPAESKCLEWKSTANFNTANKKHGFQAEAVFLFGGGILLSGCKSFTAQ
jgi:hypothetical protein